MSSGWKSHPYRVLCRSISTAEVSILEPSVPLRPAPCVSSGSSSAAAARPEKAPTAAVNVGQHARHGLTVLDRERQEPDQPEVLRDRD